MVSGQYKGTEWRTDDYDTKPGGGGGERERERERSKRNIREREIM